MSKILVIDDDPAVLKLVQRALRQQGHEVSTASNGREGLEQAQMLHPALIICDWMMPYVDGLEVCRSIKANPDLSTTFFVLLTAKIGLEDRIEGLNTGADDFLSKPIEIAELQARVRAGLRLHQVSQDLQIQKDILEAELAEAAAYVSALLPAPLQGDVTIESRFIPSRQLGGDCFDYFWLDPDVLAFYLLDVSGHGLAAALPSILVLNLLRSCSLPNANFYQPETVLSALNAAFQMSHQNEKYFTIWYGTYCLSQRQLTYASAGHPPALLLSANGQRQLRTEALPIGMILEASFISAQCSIPESSTLYIFSDGIYELSPVAQPNSQIASPSASQPSWGLESWIALLSQPNSQLDLDQVLQQVRVVNGNQSFNDDVSLLKIQFG